MDLKETTGSFEVRWTDIATGEWDKREQVNGGIIVIITAPGKGHWVAVVVKSE